ncbi:MAG: SusC/RagA family TonB-linked outer membrane protein, partial [Muribaculaceae bacterium]|nr:SusC/RagA family TonB-linked outer membrane protein [Muribaculaceae bacterium]
MKAVFRAMLALFCATMVSVNVYAQTSDVTGTVTDSDTGEPLVGVSVQVKGMPVGAATDLDGNYSVKVPANASITFSYIGYNPVTEAVNGRSRIDVAMSVTSEMMDEVVVVGYQSLKRRDVLGAVSNLGNKEITALPVASTEQALQGRVAGVQVASATGTPGSDVSVRIRGVGSIYSDNAPLYIVDGIPSANGLNNLSANDIENITVLKDASSAAIYGSRATNGVVLITTKQGKSGKAQISYNGTIGLQQATNLVEMAKTREYVDIDNEATRADNIGVISSLQRPLISDDIYARLADVDHVNEIFRNAFMTTHELSVSGGSEKVSYMVSGSYFNQDGIIRNSGYKRGTFRTNLTATVKSWLELGANINGSLSKQNLVSDSGDGYGNDQGGSVVRYAMFRNPAIPVYNQQGEYIDKPSTYFGGSIFHTYFGDGYSPEGLAEYTDRERDVKT